jgi:hypothetical protein
MDRSMRLHIGHFHAAARDCTWADPAGAPRLARPGRSVDHRDAVAVGQHRQHSCGLIGSQLRTFGMMILNFLPAFVNVASPSANSLPMAVDRLANDLQLRRLSSAA